MHGWLDHQRGMIAEDISKVGFDLFQEETNRVSFTQTEKEIGKSKEARNTTPPPMPT